MIEEEFPLFPEPQRFSVPSYSIMVTHFLQSFQELKSLHINKDSRGQLLMFFFNDFIYLFLRDREREREAETQAEGEAGSMQGAWRGTQSWVSRILPWAEGGTKPLSHGGCPIATNFKDTPLLYHIASFTQITLVISRHERFDKQQNYVTFYLNEKKKNPRKISWEIPLKTNKYRIHDFKTRTALFRT